MAPQNSQDPERSSSTSSPDERSKGGAQFSSSRSALALSSLGLVLIVASTFLSYTRFDATTSGVRLVASRTAWQMGANGSIAIGAGPSIVFWAVVAAAQEFYHYRPEAFSRGFRRSFFMSGIRTQIINAVVITVLCFYSWPGSWSTGVGTNVSRGVGGYVTMLGVALFAISINFHYHEAAAAPKRTA